MLANQKKNRALKTGREIQTQTETADRGSQGDRKTRREGDTQRQGDPRNDSVAPGGSTESQAVFERAGHPALLPLQPLRDSPTCRPWSCLEGEEVLGVLPGSALHSRQGRAFRQADLDSDTGQGQGWIW